MEISAGALNSVVTAVTTCGDVFVFSIQPEDRQCLVNKDYGKTRAACFVTNWLRCTCASGGGDGWLPWVPGAGCRVNSSAEAWHFKIH